MVTDQAAAKLLQAMGDYERGNGHPPTEIRVTSAMYAALRTECAFRAEGALDTFYGVRVVVDDAATATELSDLARGNQDGD